MANSETIAQIQAIAPNLWEISGSQQTLSAEASLKQHPMLGRGLRLKIPEGETALGATLDLYPERLVARYRSALSRLDFADVASIRPVDNYVQLDSVGKVESIQCLLYPDGSLTLGIVGNPERRDPAAFEMAPPSPPRQPPVLAQTRIEGEQPDRVVLTGRLGRDPQLRQTSTGKFIARLPLAVHRGEETDWHTILFFDAKAQEVATQLSKGQLIMVVGYRHLREIKAKTGETKTVEEIYGASVQVPK